MNRKRKVKNGRWPGPPRSFIYSEKVNNGGASNREVRELKALRDAGLEKEGVLSRVGSRLSGSRSRSQSRNRVVRDRRSRMEYDDGGYVSPQVSRTSPTSPVSRTSVLSSGSGGRSRRGRRSQYADDHYDDDYGDVSMPNRGSSRRRVY